MSNPVINASFTSNAGSQTEDFVKRQIANVSSFLYCMKEGSRSEEEINKGLSLLPQSSHYDIKEAVEKSTSIVYAVDEEDPTRIVNALTEMVNINGKTISLCCDTDSDDLDLWEVLLQVLLPLMEDESTQVITSGGDGAPYVAVAYQNGTVKHPNDLLATA